MKWRVKPVATLIWRQPKTLNPRPHGNAMATLPFFPHLVSQLSLTCWQMLKTYVAQATTGLSVRIKHNFKRKKTNWAVINVY